MASKLGLLSLPEDLLLCIFDLLEQKDKLNLSSASKKLRQLYLIGRGRKLVFHLQPLRTVDSNGQIYDEHSSGLEQLLHTSIEYKNLRITTNFGSESRKSFEDQFSDVSKIFGKDLDWYHRNSRACKTVRTLIL